VIDLAESVSPVVAKQIRQDRETTKRRQAFVERMDTLLAKLHALTV